MKINLSMLVKELTALPHTPSPKPKNVPLYVLTHILKPLRAGKSVSFADLNFEAFDEDDLDSLYDMLSELEDRTDRLNRLRSIFYCAKPDAAVQRKFC